EIPDLNFRLLRGNGRFEIKCDAESRRKTRQRALDTCRCKSGCGQYEYSFAMLNAEFNAFCCWNFGRTISAVATEPARSWLQAPWRPASRHCRDLQRENGAQRLRDTLPWSAFHRDQGQRRRTL